MRALAVVALSAGVALFHVLVLELRRLGLGTVEDREQRGVAGGAVGPRLVHVRRMAERHDTGAVRSLRECTVVRKAGEAARESRPGQRERHDEREESLGIHGGLTFPRGTAGPARPSGPRRALA